MKNEAPELAPRTKGFAGRVVRMCGALPKATAAQVIGRQVLRSGTSVGANYREARRARSKAEFIAKIGDSLKEPDETAYWLELLIAAEIDPATRLAPLQDEYNQLPAIFTTIAKRAKATG